jgi:PQQ-dependent dehydrogenase (methanol/ethanol family)
MTVKSFWAGAAISAAASAVVLSAAGQQTSVNPSFTAEQAGAGRLVFQTNCATCHGADLSGGPYAPPLAGRAFVDVWSKRSIRDLIESIRTMPPTNPRMFDDDARLNLAAYILQVNGIAAGPGRLTLTAADALASLKTSRPALAAATPATETQSGPPPCPDVAQSQTAPNSVRRGRTAGASGSEWPVYGGSSSNQRYSTLAAITSSNVNSLGGAWATQLPGRTNQTGLTMSNGLIFVPTANCKVVALNAKTGEILWEFALPERPARRGVAVGNDVGLVFAVGSTGSITAINAETGRSMWTHTLTPDPAHGRPANITSAPTYARGVLLVSISGGDSGRRGGVSALDVVTGKEIWRFYVVPRPGERGSETWPDNEMWRAGGGAVWSPPAVDLELGLVYFGTGNPNGNPNGLLGQHPTKHPGPHPSHAGDLRPGTALFTASVVALDLKTGAYRWHFQLTHHDIFDMDVVTPVVLYDTTVDGRPRKGIAVLRTDGYLFLLDRVDGSPLLPIEERPVPQDPYQVTFPTQPFPVGGDQVVPNCVEPWLMPPGFKSGCYFTPLNQPNLMVPYIGTRQAPMAYSRDTGYFYMAASVNPFWATRFGIGISEPGQRSYGLISAIDSRTNKIVWQQRSSYPLGHGGGLLATAGGLVFHGDADGNVRALDARTGEPRWQFQTGVGAASAPFITYELDGEQYIALAPSGGASPQGGLGSAQTPGDAVWAFKLGGRLQPVAPPPLPPLVQTFEGRGVVARTNEIVIDFTERNKDSIRPPGLRIDDYETFEPRRVEVPAGTRVTWKNTGHEPHTISVRGQTWSTGVIKPDSTGSIQFDMPGTYVFTCVSHPWQQGEITVRR